MSTQEYLYDEEYDLDLDEMQDQLAKIENKRFKLHIDEYRQDKKRRVQQKRRRRRQKEDQQVPAAKER